MYMGIACPVPVETRKDHLELLMVVTYHVAATNQTLGSSGRTANALPLSYRSRSSLYVFMPVLSFLYHYSSIV